MRTLNNVLGILTILTMANVKADKSYKMEKTTRTVLVPNSLLHALPDVDFEKSSLDRTNMYRAKHGVPPLEIDPKLTDDATMYAQFLASNRSLKHRPYYKYGENLYWAAKGVKSPTTDAIDACYKEINVYNFSNPKPKEDVGHFTQLVWRNSKKYGAGYAFSDDGNMYVVMNYYPSGNFNNQLKEQVPPVIDAKFEKEVLKQHNVYRLKHQVAPLEINRNLSSQAQEYAQKLAALDKLVPRHKYKYGENLFAGYKGIKSPGKVAVDTFYKAYKKYNFAKPAFSRLTGHFTQLVWKETKRIGMGYSKSKSGKVYVVCVYDPPGNIASTDEFRKNVRDVINVQFEKLILDKHNKYRRRHQAPPLNINRTMSDDAADFLADITARGIFRPQVFRRFNQNLCQTDGYYVKAGEDCVIVWYNENVHYDYDYPEYVQKASHFTQVIWKNTKEMGIATTFTPEGKFSIVINYYPPGNVVGHFDLYIRKPKRAPGVD